MLGIVLKKKCSHNGVRFKSEMAAILYINCPPKKPHLAVVRRPNNFSARTDQAENRVLEN